MGLVQVPKMGMCKVNNGLYADLCAHRDTETDHLSGFHRYEISGMSDRSSANLAHLHIPLMNGSEGIQVPICFGSPIHMVLGLILTGHNMMTAPRLSLDSSVELTVPVVTHGFSCAPRVSLLDRNSVSVCACPGRDLLAAALRKTVRFLRPSVHE